MLLNTQTQNFIRQLWLRLTPGRVALIDNLDAPVNSRQSAATALSQYNALVAAIASSPRAMWQTKIIEAPGAFSFTVPAGVRVLWYDLCGGGGGGGGGGSNGYCGGGGGGGGALFDMIGYVTPGEIITGIVGAGGNAGVSGTAPTDGATGGQTYIQKFQIGGAGTNFVVNGGYRGTRATNTAQGVGGQGGMIFGFNGDLTGRNIPGSAGFAGDASGGGAGGGNVIGVLNGKSYGSGGKGGTGTIQPVAGTGGVVILRWFGVEP
ncbi:MAG: hypothetical protein FWC38_00640 [Proteobacteria bacterium]|nr:hypothetical protein [Pseudomonadota bacterium]MCL2306749.1 hypothetical protein [Pseudomonadota bacterium]